MEPEVQMETIDDMAYYQLSRVEKLQLTWAVTWPCVALDMTLRPLRMHIGDSLPASFIEISFLLFLLFVFGPCVVRHVVRLDFANFHLAVIQHGSLHYRRDMNYKESLAVLWLVSWRPLLVALPIAVIHAALFGNSMFGQGLTLAVKGATGIIFQACWLNQAMTEKIYAHFCLVIRRASADRAEGPSSYYHPDFESANS